MTLTSTMRWLVRPVAVNASAQHRQVLADGAGLRRAMQQLPAWPEGLAEEAMAREVRWCASRAMRSSHRVDSGRNASQLEQPLGSRAAFAAHRSLTGKLQGVRTPASHRVRGPDHIDDPLPLQHVLVREPANGGQADAAAPALLPASHEERATRRASGRLIRRRNGRPGPIQLLQQRPAPLPLRRLLVLRRRQPERYGGRARSRRSRLLAWLPSNP